MNRHGDLKMGWAWLQRTVMLVGQAPAVGLVWLLRLYRMTAPFRPRCCRFYPTCSQYAIEAIQRHGAVVGIAQALWRLVRCNPLHPGGYDPVR
jgi:uncharacterized protein